MTDFLWQKNPATIDSKIMAFMAGQDVILDRQLFVYDLKASAAHVKGLASIGILDTDEADSLLTAMTALEREFLAGDFVLDERFEDGHSAIESYLTKQLGELGKRVHTGRSRNDQVLVATRLLLRDKLELLQARCSETATLCIARAQRTADMPMPGYTHLQRAVVSSVGLWFAALAESFIDNAFLARDTRSWIDANPLGTAAGFGVNLPLDRRLTTRELGFSRIQVNPIYAQNSRGKFEIQVLGAFAQALLDVRRLAWDLSLYSTAEFNFIRLPDRFTTGSSIMPNKRNPDLVELLRAAYPCVQAAILELQSLLSLPSGYQRDLQNTKPPLLRGLQTGCAVMDILPDLLASLEFNEQALGGAMEPAMHATDRAMELAAEGVPFRDAYRTVMNDMAELATREPLQSVHARVSPGGCANLMLEELSRRLEQLRQ
ncbi:MAG: argininosuccinate lyase [Gammaproteobacteria bacterium]|nr:argininosuccinate lyase [Gammaproteobacteria bacterium]